MKTLINKVVLITGGAMGVGRKLAERSAQAGARVVLWDVNEKALQNTAKALRAQDGEVYTYLVDVANVTDIETQAQNVLREVGTVDILFNNAGIVVGSAFVNHTVAQIEKTIRVNTLGIMHVARVFLPGMIQKGEGSIINMASAAGYIGNPNMSVYAASKWAVIGWSESLRLEMKKNGLPIQVTTVTPSYIDTGMFEGVKAPLLTPILQPEAITHAIWQGMLKGKAFVRAPIIINLLVILKRILPVKVFDFVVGEVFRVYTSMDTFKGHHGRHAH